MQKQFRDGAFQRCAVVTTRLLMLILVLGWTGEAAARQAESDSSEPRPIRALYITGGGFHDFVAQERIIPEGIAARTNIEWTVDRTADTATAALIARHENTAWADEFDVVVYNMSFSWVVDAGWIDRLAYAHRDRGVAAVLLHGAVHSYRRSESDAWRELMGVASYRHDDQRAFTIEKVASEHPIVRGVPEGWGPGVDELYEIQEIYPGMTPLARAYSVETETYSPVVWTNVFGDAKVFVTTMGHNNRTMEDPVYLDMVTRGLLWTLDLLEEDGTPAPGYGPPADATR
ncbi:MAG TPA: ThuA domain-containing protein [Longimicrobiales bacterium]|nr:ThuA domain-containing protein [Longimicrobiales bacterium]